MLDAWMRCVKRWSTLLALVLAVSCGAGSPTTTPSHRASGTTPSPTTLVSPSPAVSPTPESLAGTGARAVRTITGVVAPVFEARPDGAIVGTPCGQRTLVAEGYPISEATVVLDPGHGGSETGAVGPNGLTEKELNLAVAKFTMGALEKIGTRVVLTRTGDYRITLQARAAIAKSLRPKAFVSIHHNGDADGPRSGPGTETFYQTVGASAAESKRLAGLLYEEITRALGAFEGVSWVADTDAGAKYRKSASGQDYYGILRHTQGIAAVISEAAFLSNPSEAELLSSAEVQQAEAQAIARAVTRFLTTREPGSGFTEPYLRRQPAGSGGGTAGCIDPPLDQD